MVSLSIRNPFIHPKARLSGPLSPHAAPRFHQHIKLMARRFAG
jgi:hypothetical protein